jgi:hypothetical protein
MKKTKKEEGVAMIVATVVGMILIVFTLSLLLVAYSLFSSVAAKRTQNQCEEVAKSVSQELGQELINVNYDSYLQQSSALGRENNLWFFLRYNLWQQETWPYYNDGETGHNEEDSYRYFTINAVTDEKFAGMADQILVTAYWDIDSDNPQTETDKSMTEVHFKVEVQKGDSAYVVESSYALTVTPYDNTQGYGNVDTVENSTINPDNKYIDQNEKWVWVTN